MKYVLSQSVLLSLYNIFENSSSVANSWKTIRLQLSDFPESHFKRHYGLKSDVVDCIHWSCNKLRMKKAKHCLLQRGNFLLTVQQLIICIMPWLEVQYDRNPLPFEPNTKQVKVIDPHKSCLSHIHFSVMYHRRC